MQQGFCKFYPTFPARLYDLITPLILVLHPRLRIVILYVFVFLQDLKLLFMEKWMKLILLHQYHTKVKKNLWRHLSLWLSRRRITMKTTIDFNFSNIMDTHKHGNKEKLSINSFSLFTCKLAIWEKKLVRNKNWNEKVVFVVLI